ncbi:MAG TPA: hypothetical protein VNQ76_02000 [Planctomicrobium sp.]|nr:hypothetical protein [Planctomicrobium sp.]
MSGQFVSLLALVPMLFHSIWGCCWHHDHPVAEHDRAVLEVVQIEHPHCGSHHDHSEHHDESSPGEPSHESPCDEEPCLSSGALLTIVPQHVQLETWGLLSSGVIDLTDLLKPQLVSRDLWHRLPLPDSEGERRAMIQIWLI